MSNNLNTNQRQKQKIMFGVWLIILGLAFLSSNYLMMKKDKVYEDITFDLSQIPTQIEQEVTTPDEEITDVIEDRDEENDNDIEDNNDSNLSYVTYDYYIGRLEIPSINLVKGFASKNSKQNNVNKNVAIMTPCDYPDVLNGNFILAAHNGNGWNSYFRYLYKLKNNDIAYVYYNGMKYSYRVVNIYKVKKTGTVRIHRNLDATTLTLITCTKGDKTTQTVFILERYASEIEK